MHPDFEVVNTRDLYVIVFKGLPNGTHSFEWLVDKSFFVQFENSEIEDAQVNVNITLIKHSQFLELNFTLAGWAEVICDRCLDPLKVPIKSEAQLYVKFGDDNSSDEAEDLDIIMLPYEVDRIDVSQYIYEYAHLSLPIRRVHPTTPDGKSLCNSEMLNKLSQYLVGKGDENE